jgi:RNA-directed DNA polymerase
MIRKPTLESEDDLRREFLALQTPREVAKLLKIEYSDLTYLLFRSGESTRYREFSIPKKSGGSRTILSPNGSLKSVQRKLNKFLQAAYPPKPSTRGFIKETSVLNNALPHLKSSYVFNVDLKDFFPSINFGRVRGMLMARPYNLNRQVATILAQICCHKNHIPPGAPTSPIISNMICSKMDSALQRLARKHRCFYTRYADDLTFSTRLPNFSEGLASRNADDSKALPGPELQTIIEDNGFSINFNKVRLQSQDRRQRVTGVIVNTIPNVPRTYIREIRGMLHAWEKWGLPKAEEDFLHRHDYKHRNPAIEQVSFKEVVRGKLTYLKMIKGGSDPVYGKLRSRYDKLDPRFTEHRSKSFYDELLDSIWILESPKDSIQGTAFMLSDYGLITCAHVLRADTVAFRAREHYKTYPVKVLKENKDLDIAILSIEAAPSQNLEADMDYKPKHLDKITLAGFPNYNTGDTGIIAEGKISGFRPISGIKRFLITAAIIAGNSGGPVVSKDNKVVGIAATGADTWENADKTEKHGVIPICVLNSLN